MSAIKTSWNYLDISVGVFFSYGGYRKIQRFELLIQSSVDYLDLQNT